MAPSPHLPADFLEKLRADSLIESSASFTQAFHHERLQMTNNTSFRHPDHPIELTGMPNEIGGPALERSNLHIAAITGDAVLTCEMIRLGTTIDLQDTTGKTPLYLAIEIATACRKSLSDDLARATSRPKPEKTLRSVGISMLRRLRFVIRTLLEQHANPNCSYNGVTSLQLACSIQDWDVITLLLQHGANPPTAPGSLMKKAADKSRLLSLINSTATSTRPRRMCPCWSGKPLAECHDAESKPYPLDFLCRCGTGRTFRKCCNTRKIEFSERWDDKEQWILTSQMRQVPFPFPDSQAAEKNVELLMDLGVILPKYTAAHFSSFVKDTADKLQSMGLIDAAFAYALRRTGLVPRPRGRRMSKGECLEVQEQWNKVVDEYIDLGEDGRPKEVIERAAKIGPSNGALYRTCEGVGCNNTEGYGGVKVRLCSKCKISVYCSSTCQSSAWRTHKTICGSEKQVEQALPSQCALEEHFGKQWNKLANVDLTPPPELAPFVEALRSSNRRS